MQQVSYFEQRGRTLFNAWGKYDEKKDQYLQQPNRHFFNGTDNKHFQWTMSVP